MVPVQVTDVPENVGVTVMVAVAGIVPLLIATKDAILPVPIEARPIDGFVFDHANAVPDTGLLNTMVEVEPPLHTTWLATAFTDGVGLTVMVKTTGTPVQVIPPLVTEGITVMVATTGALPVLVAVKVPILPVPLAANPMDVCEFVQL